MWPETAWTAKGGRKSGKDEESLTIRVPQGTLIRTRRPVKLSRICRIKSLCPLQEAAGAAGATSTLPLPPAGAPLCQGGSARGEPRRGPGAEAAGGCGPGGLSPMWGKSTLLSVVSKAHPKIANYHFTTLYPNLGVVYVETMASASSWQIFPASSRGASEGAGLGHDFLRHIDRCRLLVHLVDVSGSEGRDPVADFDAINDELKNYSPELARRPQIVVGNKTDLCRIRSSWRPLKKPCEEAGYSFLEMSAATHQGRGSWYRPSAGCSPAAAGGGVRAGICAPASGSGHLPAAYYPCGGQHLAGGGPWLQRLMANINFSDYESRMYFDKMLRQSGLFDRLEQMGIRTGILCPCTIWSLNISTDTIKKMRRASAHLFLFRRKILPLCHMHDGYLIGSALLGCAAFYYFM